MDSKRKRKLSALFHAVAALAAVQGAGSALAQQAPIKEYKQSDFPVPAGSLTTADCLPGRHWELVPTARCVCDGDLDHVPVSNDQPSACVRPPPTLIVSRSPTFSPVGTGFSLSWSSSKAWSVAFSCAGVLPGSGTVATTGNTGGTYAVVGTTTCNWTATGLGGVASQTESFTVAAAPTPAPAPTPVAAPTPAPAPVTVAAPTPAPLSCWDSGQRQQSYDACSAGYSGQITNFYGLTACSDGSSSWLFAGQSNGCVAIATPAPAPAPVAAAPAPAPVPETVGGSFCSGTTLVGWMTPSGSQFVQEANSGSCGYPIPVVVAPAPPPIAPVVPASVAAPYVIWSMEYVNCGVGYTQYAWSDGSYSYENLPWDNGGCGQ